MLHAADHQWLSTAVGAIVNSATGSTIQTGAGVAVDMTRGRSLFVTHKTNTPDISMAKDKYLAIMEGIEVDKEIAECGRISQNS